MNFAAIVGSLLRSGYALPTQRPDNGALQNQLADDPLIESEMLSRLSRPPLLHGAGSLGLSGARCFDPRTDAAQDRSNGRAEVEQDGLTNRFDRCP